MYQMILFDCIVILYCKVKIVFNTVLSMYEINDIYKNSSQNYVNIGYMYTLKHAN